MRPRYPELEVPLVAAIDAFDVILSANELAPHQLRPIVDAVSSSRRPLYENASGFMKTLSAKWPEVNAAILAMSRSSKAHVRFNAILCLGNSTPADIIEKVLKSGLLDKSSRVRGKAADWIGRLRRRELVGELAAALSVEHDQKARSTIEFELRLLRDGYILEPEKDGGYRVTVHTDNGGVRSDPVDEVSLRTRGIDAIASELRRPAKWETMQ